MLPVDQTTHGPHDGNCFSACVASILEIPIEDVPRFHGDDFRRWLAARGLFASRYRSDVYVPPGYSIAIGRSRRFAGKMHACVAYAGAVVHDPHYSREGLPFGIVDYVVIHGPRGEALWFSGA